MNLAINNTHGSYYSKPLKNTNKSNNTVSDNFVANNTEISFGATNVNFKMPRIDSKAKEKGAIIAFFAGVMAKVFGIKAIQEEELSPAEKIAKEQSKLAQKARNILKTISMEKLKKKGSIWKYKSDCHYEIVYLKRNDSIWVTLHKRFRSYPVILNCKDGSLQSINDTCYQDGKVVEDLHHVYDSKTGKIIEDKILRGTLYPLNDAPYSLISSARNFLYIDHNTQKVLRYETPTTKELINDSQHTVIDKESGETILSFNEDEIRKIKTDADKTVIDLIKRTENEIDANPDKYTSVVFDTFDSEGDPVKQKITILNKDGDYVRKEIGSDAAEYVLHDEKGNCIEIESDVYIDENEADEVCYDYEGIINGRYIKNNTQYCDFDTEIDKYIITFDITPYGTNSIIAEKINNKTDSNKD